MYELKKMERYLPVNLLGPGPRLMKKEFTGPRSHKSWETLCYITKPLVMRIFRVNNPVSHWHWTKNTEKRQTGHTALTTYDRKSLLFHRFSGHARTKWRRRIWPDIKGKAIPFTGLDRPWGFQEAEAPRFQDNRYTKVVSLSDPRTGRIYPTRKYSWYSFLLEAESTPGP